MISIVIPAHNEEKYLGRTLESAASQGFNDKEIIVVCDSCKDKTYDIARKFTEKAYSVSFSSAPAAKNFGAKKARGSMLMFLDADTKLVSGDFLAKLDAVYKRRGPFIGTSLFLPDNKKIRFILFSFVKNIASFFGMANGVLFIDRKTFNELGRFDISLFPLENGKLIKRARKRLKFRHLLCFVETSMRRHESVGFVSGLRYWHGRVFKNSEESYKVIR